MTIGSNPKKNENPVAFSWRQLQILNLVMMFPAMRKCVRKSVAVMNENLRWILVQGQTNTYVVITVRYPSHIFQTHILWPSIIWYTEKRVPWATIILTFFTDAGKIHVDVEINIFLFWPLCFIEIGLARRQRWWPKRCPLSSATANNIRVN